MKLVRVSSVDFWRTPIRIMIFFGLYYLVKRAIYLSSRKILNGGEHKKKAKKSKRKNKRIMKGRAYFYFLFLINALLMDVGFNIGLFECV